MPDDDKRLPYFNFYPTDYITKTRKLKRDEHGAYCLLLFHSWMDKDCSLPNDEEELREITKCDPRSWARIRANVLEVYFSLSGDRWENARLRREFARVREKSSKAANSARARHGRKPLEDKETEDANAERTQSDRIAIRTEQNRTEQDQRERRACAPGSDAASLHRLSLPLPSGWMPDEESVRIAGEHRVKAEALERTLKKFRTYYEGKRSTDWQKKFRLWVMNERTETPAQAQPDEKPMSLAERARKLAAERAEKKKNHG